MHSMTGFGKAQVATKAGKFMVEAASVNNRYLEIQIRQPRHFAALETKLRELVGSLVQRGKVSLYVGYEAPTASGQRYPLDEDAAVHYYKRLKALGKRLGSKDEVKLESLLLLPDVIAPSVEPIDEDAVWPGLERAAKRALNAMVRMRAREGKAIGQDMTNRLKTLRQLTRTVMTGSDQAVLEYRKKLSERVSQLLNGRLPDQVRLEEEIALVAERTDITEECTRLLSHLDQCGKAVRSKGTVGKRINFLLQELNREANTIASKCSEIDISRAAISMKEEVEKLREQVQNVE